jgi:membrane protease YdiL (CAAX protease family)
MFALALGKETKSRPLRPSAPVVLAALFFALMHLPLIMLGVSPGALVILLPTAFLLGWIAGYVRERTGSVVPAILVHAVFNVSGSLTDWWVK